MKIAAIETRQLTLEDRVSTLVFVHSDGGLIGVGETSYPDRPETLRAAIEEIKQGILGFDPFNASAIRAQLASVSNVSNSVLLRVAAGVEAACLDLMGRQLGVPVFQFFGGTLRDEVRACAASWEKLSDSPEDYARKACEVANSGFTAIKFDPFGHDNSPAFGPMLERAAEVTRCIREAVDADVDLIADANARFTPTDAVFVARALEPFNLMWLEDPIQTDDPATLAKVSKSVTSPIAVGKRVRATHVFREVIECQLAEFVQLDCQTVGGFISARAIAVLAESYYMNVALHHAGGPIALAINAHFAACTPNLTVAEIPYPPRPSWNSVLRVPIKIENGLLKVPSGPGWGVECHTEVENRVVQTTA